MDFTYPLPKLDYSSHEDMRRKAKYAYADDLINDYNWRTDLKEFDSKINSYIDQRNKFGQINNKGLRNVGIPGKNARSTLDIYKTLSGNIINHQIFIKLGEIIKYRYEHIKPEEKGLSLKTGSNVVDIEKIPKKILEEISELSDITKKLENNILEITKISNIEFYKEFLESKSEEKKGILVGENPNLSIRYELHPEIIGNDIANITSDSTNFMSTSFVSGGLLDWRFITPQQRSVGSAADIGSIIMDIIFQLTKNNFNQISTKDKKIVSNNLDKNANYAYSEAMKYYEPLLSSDIIDKLSSLNTDVVSENPFMLGILKGDYKKPEAYGIWCINRCIKTPFYNRESIKESSSINLIDLIRYSIEIKSDNTLELKIKNTNENNIDLLIQSILKVLGIAKKKEDEKKIQSVLDIKDIVTEFNSQEINTSLSFENLRERVLIQIQKVLNDKSKSIILLKQASTVLFLNLLVLAGTNWDEIKELYGSSIFFPLPILKYKTEITKDKYIENSFGKENIYKTAQAEFDKFRKIIRDYFGIVNNEPMGGLSLVNGSFSVSKFGKISEYPGDISILEGISEYVSLLLSDLSIIRKRLNDSQINLANKYWYRDILLWLEVMFRIFEPNILKPNEQYTSAQLKIKFFQLEKIIKILYSKQITITNNYVQKYNLLSRKKNANQIFQKQVDNASAYYKTTVCYIKRQIVIIYHLLDRISDSWWTTTPSSPSRKRRPLGPAFLENDFKPAYRIMKSSLKEWFLSEITKIRSPPELTNEIRKLSADLCSSVDPKSKVMVSQKFLRESSQTIITDLKFWFLLIANMKNIPYFNNKPQLFQKLYIPVYFTSTNNRSYYLFDLMPLLTKGDYKGAFGNLPSPRWLSPTDLEKSDFSNENKAIFILTNRSSDIGNKNKWGAIDIKWFDKLLQKVSEVPDKKMIILRSSIYILLSDPSIYDSSILNKQILSSNSESNIKIRNIFEKFQQEGNPNTLLVSREYIKNEIDVAETQVLNV